MPIDPGPHDLNKILYILGPDGSATLKADSPDFYQELNTEFNGFAGHTLISRFSFDEPWSTWEMHPMGDEFQWATFSIGYARDSWWFPGARIGYRENLAGTRLQYLGIGFTAFRYFNFDVSSALDTVKIDGQTLPLGVMLSLGFEIAW